ncbi:hypothetical protein FHY65_24705 [Bacillus cereus]|uniref:hypothetical protein n=1 Tax=Bacillus cereus TaxID=1396 RepID=UPI000BFE89C8|nr:hypothetical protein [Bacillus cereus]MDA2396309.1 hypothetical protein [Bacillus cereus]PGO25296.1 hypothetical protein CN982_22115 [Bacillus cereus]TNO99997.1 hypothetical protein FHY65_24705 [Bacillus cereus]
MSQIRIDVSRLPIHSCKECGLDSHPDPNKVKWSSRLHKYENGTEEIERGMYVGYVCGEWHTQTEFFNREELRFRGIIAG